MYTAQMLSQMAEARSIASRVDHELREGHRLAALLEAACAAIAAEPRPEAEQPVPLAAGGIAP